MKAAHEKKIEELTAQGWEYDHSATHPSYHYAGTTEPMKTRHGYDYLRVFHGKTANKKGMTFQVTTVMRRAAE